MGVSIQQYRLVVQTFNHSTIFSYKGSKPKYMKMRKASRKLKPGPWISLLLLLCTFSTCTSNCDVVSETSSHYSHSIPQFPTIICTSTIPNHSVLLHPVLVTADDPPDPGGRVRWQQQLDAEQPTGTSLYKIRKCVFMTRSTNIEDYNFLARYTHGNRRGSGLKLCHWNKGPAYLENSIPEIEHIIAEYKPHILGISEANHHAHHSLDDVQIDDYNLYLADTLNNPELNISRVAVYVHKDIIVTVRDDLMTDSFSSVWLEVGLKRQKKFLVSNVYRDWKYVNQADQESGSIASQLSRWESFLQQWESAIATDQEIHVLGDMNLNYLDIQNQSIPPNSHSARLRPLVHALLDRVVPHGFSQLITDVTRVWPGQESSLLDHHWTNKPEKISSTHAFYQGGSDHKMIFSVRHTKQIISKPRIIKKRCFKNFKPGDFIAAVQGISWYDVYMTEDVEAATKLVTGKLTAILDVMAPVKTIQSRAKFAPWLSEDTKKKILLRNEAQKRAAQSNLKSDWDDFKRKRNQINNILKTEKRTWQEKKISSFGADSSSIWKNVKNWLGWSKGGPPSKLIEGGIVYNKPKDLARIMNSFFINKVRMLRENLQQNPGNPLLLVEKLMQNRSCSFRLKSVHPDTVLKTLSNLKSSSSCGTDEIGSNVLKLVKNEITPVLTHIINLSISNQTFPKLWKQAKVIPLHKKAEVLYTKNYRPVSLLSVLSKVLERCIFGQMIDYLETNQLLHPSHHGFRAKHSTVSALAEMFDTWVEAFEDDEVSAVVMLDMSAAFDVVDHDILIRKMALYGFEESALSWVKSYLTNRTQSVFIEGSLSDPLPVECGVPQGSILGPLLYILFTNDLPEAIHDHLPGQVHQQEHQPAFYNTKCGSCGGLCLYADDSTLTLSNKDVQQLNTDIDEKYKMVAQYMARNKLILNSDKTHLLVMTSTRKHQLHQDFGISLNTGTEIIQPQSQERLLGATVSNTLSWNSHIRGSEASLTSCLTSRINALSKVCLYSNFVTRKMVANGLVMSYLTYLIPLYGGCTDYLLSALQILQNRAARLATKSNWGTSSSKMLTQLGWLSVKQMIVFHSLMLFFKAKLYKKPVHLHGQISVKFGANTRLGLNNGIREIRRFQTTLGRQSFVPRTISHWNNLPATIRNISRIGIFKEKLRSWVKDNF